MFYKQTLLLNPEYQPIIHVYGCGSIGSHLIISLVKMGFKNLNIYDYDIVEDGNIPAQMFMIEHIDKFKVDGIKDLTIKFIGTDTVNINTGKIDETFIPSVELNSIHIFAFDNIEARKILINKLMLFPLHIIDARIGAFEMEIYYATKNYERYLKTLEGNFSELQCGEKCLYPVNQMISSKICSLIIRMSKGIELPFAIRMNLLSDLTIVGD